MIGKTVWINADDFFNDNQVGFMVIKNGKSRHNSVRARIVIDEEPIQITESELLAVFREVNFNYAEICDVMDRLFRKTKLLESENER